MPYRRPLGCRTPAAIDARNPIPQMAVPDSGSGQQEDEAAAEMGEQGMEMFLLGGSVHGPGSVSLGARGHDEVTGRRRKGWAGRPHSAHTDPKKT